MLVGVDSERFHLVAPFEFDPGKWTAMPWTDRYSGRQFRLSTNADEHRPDVAFVKTMRDVLEEFRTHPEAKSADQFSKRSNRQTIGSLHRREVQETFIAHVGKESNRLEEADAGLLHDVDAVRTEYTHPTRTAWTHTIVPKLREQNFSEFSKSCDISERQLRALATGRPCPHGGTRLRIKQALADIPPISRCEKIGRR